MHTPHAMHTRKSNAGKPIPSVLTHIGQHCVGNFFSTSPYPHCSCRHSVRVHVTKPSLHLHLVQLSYLHSVLCWLQKQIATWTANLELLENVRQQSNSTHRNHIPIHFAVSLKRSCTHRTTFIGRKNQRFSLHSKSASIYCYRWCNNQHHTLKRY